MQGHRSFVRSFIHSDCWRRNQTVSHTVLSSRRGSKSSSLPGSGVLACAPVRLLLLLSSWHVLAPAVGRSGMNSATMKAANTVHAPSRKGGPGIATRWQINEKNREVYEVMCAHVCVCTHGLLTWTSRLHYCFLRQSFYSRV